MAPNGEQEVDRARPHLSVEEDLRRSKEFLETILDSMNDALSVIDVKDFRIVEVNKVFLNSYGLEAREVIGKPCYEVTHHRLDPCAPPDDLCPLKETLRTGRHAVADHVHYRPGGEKVFVEVSTSPIRDRDGNLIQVVHIARDITGRKMAEAAIRKYAAELEEANRLKDLFTDILGHDLLNPIIVIGGFAARLAAGGQERAPEMIAAIRNSAKKVEDIVRNVSKYARVKSFERLEKSDLDLTLLLESVVERHEAEANEKGMTIAFERQGPAGLAANPLLEDVFSNLISNAVKYTPRDTTIVVSVAEEPEHWLVSCADQGDGIPDAYKESIFDRFERRDKMGVKGTGLGLAIAKRIVGLHGGAIWVEDNPAGGSVFRVRLPKRPR
jgi:PAS domain S-box-containing protein